MPDELTIEGITIEALMDTWKIELSGMIWEMVNKRPNKRLGFIPNYKHIVDYIANQIAWSKKRKQAELLLELLQVFNDYDVPLTMTAEQVRDILEAYLTKKD